MNFTTSTKRIIKGGFSNFRRNTFVSLAAILIMVITLFVIGSVIFMGQILNASLSQLQDKVDVSVYFVPDAAEPDILALQKKIDALPEVKGTTYQSQEQVLQAFQERHKDDVNIIRGLNELDSNPLGAAVNIKAFKPSQYQSVQDFLQGNNLKNTDGTTIVDTVSYGQNKSAIDTLSRIIDSVNKMGFTITFVLILLSILITFNTIRLAIYISRDEINVMKLVGASRSYIRGPFVVSGIIYGVISSLITLALLYPLTLWLGKATADFFLGINIFDYYVNNFGQIALIISASGIVIGSISSYFAVRKYLSR